MNLWAQYKQEREGISTYETDFGFFSYRIFKEHIEVYDIFIVEACRDVRTARELWAMIQKFAEERQLKYIFGCIDPAAKKADRSFKIMLHIGFKPSHISEKVVWLVKEV